MKKLFKVESHWSAEWVIARSMEEAKKKYDASLKKDSVPRKDREIDKLTYLGEVIE